MTHHAWETCQHMMTFKVDKVDLQDPTTFLMRFQCYSTEELNCSPRATYNAAGLGEGLHTSKLKDMLVQ